MDHSFEDTSYHNLYLNRANHLLLILKLKVSSIHTNTSAVFCILLVRSACAHLSIVCFMALGHCTSPLGPSQIQKK